MLILQIFDLKGSVRNRFVDTSGKRVEDVVLLDENLVKGKYTMVLLTDTPVHSTQSAETYTTHNKYVESYRAYICFVKSDRSVKLCHDFTLTAFSHSERCLGDLCRFRFLSTALIWDLMGTCFIL